MSNNSLENQKSIQIRQNLKTENVLHILDAEINQILSEVKFPGWTTWAIYGAIATVIWLLFHQIEASKINTIIVKVLLLVFFLIFDFISVIKVLLSPKDYNERQRNRFYQSRIFANNRLELFVMLLLSLGLLIIAKTINLLNLPYPYLIIGIYSVLSIIYMLVLILSFLKFPISAFPQSSAYILIIPVVLLSAILASIYGCISMIYNQVNISDIKVASLIFALCYLIILLTKRTHNTPLLSTLINIRRDLAFDQISVENAVQQADIALTGLTMSDILQEDVQKILGLIEKMNLDYGKEIDAVKAIKKQLPNNLTELSSDQKILIETVAKSCSPHKEDIKIQISSLKILISKFHKKINLLKRMSGGHLEIENIMTLIGNAITDLERKFKEFFEESESLNKIQLSTLNKNFERKG